MTHSHPWHPFVMISLALIIGTMGTALASPLYPIYQEVWQLLPSHITFIFVAYMLGCLATLLFLGRTSNSIGFLKTLELGLIIITLGLILSMFATNALWLALGRFVIGIASGLMTTSALIGLMWSIPQSHKAHAPQLSSVITAVGFGLGPLLGGGVAQFSAAPLFSPYIPVILGAVLCFIGLLRLAPPEFTPQTFSIAPKLERPEPRFHAEFYITGLTAFCVFAAFSLFASLSPSFVQVIIPWHGPLVSGLAITSILLISAVSQFVAKSMSMHKALNIGLYTLILSYILLSICMIFHIGFLFFISDILVGIGHGFGLLGAFALVHHMTNSNNRAAIVSTYLFLAYLGTIVPIIAVGFLADHFGMMTGVLGFCLGMSLLCIYLLVQHFKYNIINKS